MAHVGDLYPFGFMAVILLRLPVPFVRQGSLCELLCGITVFDMYVGVCVCRVCVVRWLQRCSIANGHYNKQSLHGHQRSRSMWTFKSPGKALLAPLDTQTCPSWHPHIADNC